MIKFLELKKITDRYSSEIHEAVSRVIDSGWYLQGKENEKFEADYSTYIGTRYTVGCANGLDALIWIFRAYVEMGMMKPGDEVIVPANTYIASILAISENGLIPVLVEPNLETYQIDDSRNVPIRIRSESCARSIVSSWWRTMRRHMVACLRDGRPAHWETLQVIAFTRVRTWEPWVTEVR